MTPEKNSEKQLRALAEFVKIETPSEWRALLMNSAVAVLEGRITVMQSNAIASLSVEVHKSLRQEWDMRCYVAETITMENGQVKRLDATRQ